MPVQKQLDSNINVNYDTWIITFFQNVMHIVNQYGILMLRMCKKLYICGNDRKMLAKQFLFLKNMQKVCLDMANVGKMKK